MASSASKEGVTRLDGKVALVTGRDIIKHEFASLDAHCMLLQLPLIFTTKKKAQKHASKVGVPAIQFFMFVIVQL
jgi:hypothetical protein